MSAQMKTKNKKRVKRAHIALKGYYEKDWKVCVDCREQAVSDLLADLRHYCDRWKLNFHSGDRRAHNHYTEEK